MATLDRRITALERKSESANDGRVIVIRFVEVGGVDAPVTELAHGGKTWHRLPDESEDAFHRRVLAEVPHGRSGTRVALFAC